MRVKPDEVSDASVALLARRGSFTACCPCRIPTSSRANSNAASVTSVCAMIFGGVFARFPKLRVAFAHGGGAFPFTIGRIEHAFHVRPDVCAINNKTRPRSYLATPDRPALFYVDSLAHDSDALKLLIKLFGAQRVALGSDYPFPLG